MEGCTVVGLSTGARLNLAESVPQSPLVFEFLFIDAELVRDARRTRNLRLLFATVWAVYIIRFWCGGELLILPGGASWINECG
jgi:hypothetical protein